MKIGISENEIDTDTPVPPDPFDPASLRLTGDLTQNIGVKKLLLTVPVKKPEKSWFVRTHPDPAYSLNTCVIELKEDREMYLVVPDLWPELAAEGTFKPMGFITSISRQNVPFLWPIRLPGPDGKLDEWGRSAREAAEIAKTKWCRVQANLSLGAYEVTAATGALDDPDWPEVPFADLLRVAFRDKRIDSLDHPVLRKLRGEL